jgi:hypothetical protein
MNSLRKKSGKKIPLTITSKNFKYLGINLIKKVKDLYNENYKTTEEIVEDTRKWKDASCSWIEDLIL